jgi:hypothetical protein
MLARSFAVCAGLAAALAACSAGSSNPGPTPQSCGPAKPCTAPAWCDPLRYVCVYPDARVQPRTEAGIPVDGPPNVRPDGPITHTDSYVPPTDSGVVAEAGTCKPDETWCGTRCVNTRVNLQHCGGCNNSCGPMSGSHATCNNGTCECYHPYLNCDSDWATNGCECPTACDGTQCKVVGCDPNKAGDCNDTFKYCSSVDRTCKVCQTGWENCDQLSSCECKVTSYSCINGTCQ